MQKIISAVLVAVVGFTALQWLRKYEIKGIDSIQVVPRDATRDGNGHLQDPSPRGAPVVRIATFNIQVFGSTKMSKPEVVDTLAKIVRQFDLVAIQEIRSRDQDLLPRFVDIVNSSGRQFDYVIGPRLPYGAPGGAAEQYAFVFDKQVLEVDRSQLYTIDDPDDLLAREPLVAWFRVRGPPPDEAFTFTLVNIHTDPDQAAFEVDQLAQVYQVVVNDGRGEDDVIILGDFNVDDRHLGRLGQVPGMEAAVVGVPTNTRGTHGYDNILFQKQATVEFTGRAGVYDFMREFNLTLDQALQVSDHLPVWAEFNVYEGGRPGLVADRPNPRPR